MSLGLRCTQHSETECFFPHSYLMKERSGKPRCEVASAMAPGSPGAVIIMPSWLRSYVRMDPVGMDGAELGLGWIGNNKPFHKLLEIDVYQL